MLTYGGLLGVGCGGWYGHGVLNEADADGARVAQLLGGGAKGKVLCVKVLGHGCALQVVIEGDCSDGGALIEAEEHATGFCEHRCRQMGLACVCVS